MNKTGKMARLKGRLNQSPSHLMHRALQLALDIYAEETASDGLTQRQFAVLEAVSARAGLTQSDLVKATGIDRSTLADLVARMASRGLLERERSPLDARAMAVHLSQTGKLALEEARPRVAAADKRILSLLPKTKRDSFMNLLISLAAAADAAPEQARAEAKAARKAARQARKVQKKALRTAEVTETSAQADQAASAPAPAKPVAA